MAVAADTSFVGSLSGGCIEAAVVTEALATIAANTPRELSFGAGSRFIDLRLPCGGRIDLLITPVTDAVLAAQLMEEVENRRAFTLALPRHNGVPRIEHGDPAARLVLTPDLGVVTHLPDMKLIILGHGASVTALVRLARALDIETLTVSPDMLTRDQALALGATTQNLKLPTDAPPAFDAWTAAVFLFHEHEWETALLLNAVRSTAFFVGAMGSHKTHASRVAALVEAGASAEECARIVAPIGLIPSSRDPETLALSVLTQVVEAYHARVAQVLPVSV